MIRDLLFGWSNIEGSLAEKSIQNLTDRVPMKKVKMSENIEKRHL
jgi:hypothetical protein